MVQSSVKQAEGLMMYKKAILFGDLDTAEKILLTNDPKKQKELGKTAKGFNQEIWDKNKLDIVVEANILKFSQNEKLKKYLLKTGDKVLVEGSPYDRIWGVGIKWDNPLILDDKNWKGANLLGKALMEVRDIFRNPIKNQKRLNEFFLTTQQEILGDSLTSPQLITDNEKKILMQGVIKSQERIDSYNFEELLLNSAKEAVEHAKGNTELKTTEVSSYDKLVRDKMPQIINKDKKSCETVNEIDKNKLLAYYIKKLELDFNTINQTTNKKNLISGLANLSEVIDGLLDNLELRESVEKEKKDKSDKKGKFSNLILKSVRRESHDWIIYKEDKFRSCKKCGTIENDKITNWNCVGQVKLELRVSDKDFDQVQKEISHPSEPHDKLKKAFSENSEIKYPSTEGLKEAQGILNKIYNKSSEGLKGVTEGRSMSTEDIKEKLTTKKLFKEIEGSILKAKEDIIAQGCNCSGASGAGIAKYIGQEYPVSDSKYKKLCKDKAFHLGSVMFNEEKGKTQAFCGTQIYYGKFLKMDDESVEKRYKAIEECLIKIYTKAKAENLSVALPRIGCGRARSSWKRVKEIIKKVFHDYPVSIYWIPDKYSKK